MALMDFGIDDNGFLGGADSFFDEGGRKPKRGAVEQKKEKKQGNITVSVKMKQFFYLSEN